MEHISRKGSYPPDIQQQVGHHLGEIKDQSKPLQHTQFLHHGIIATTAAQDQISEAHINILGSDGIVMLTSDA